MNGQRVLLKDQLFNTDKVAQIAAELNRSHREFDAHAFEQQVMSRLPDLELKQRIAWITDCLAANLPDDYRRAVRVLLASLPAPCDPALSDGDFGDFIYAPVRRVRRPPRVYGGRSRLLADRAARADNAVLS